MWNVNSPAALLRPHRSQIMHANAMTVVSRISHRFSPSTPSL
jgi:hypothetical protein